MEGGPLVETPGERPPLEPLEYVRRRLSRSRSSFDLVIRLLPGRQRIALSAFYAFCREVDDAVDEAPSPDIAARHLAAWRAEVAEACAGRPGHPALRILMPQAKAYGIEAAHLHSIVDGCQMDLGLVRHADFASLERYCLLVAGVVGEVAARVFGFEDAATLRYARRLGVALQLTNIVRDVGEDARRGRLYLPLEDLRRFDVGATEILEGEFRGDRAERFRSLMRFEARRAHDIYDDALALLPRTDRRRQWPGLAMAGVYRTLLRRIEAEGFPVLDRRCRLVPAHLAWIVCRILVLRR